MHIFEEMSRGLGFLWVLKCPDKTEQGKVIGINSTYHLTKNITKYKTQGTTV